MAFIIFPPLQAGRLLAHVLMGSGHGDRPVTLIGHSMGARVIFHCLLELCRHNCKGAITGEWKQSGLQQWDVTSARMHSIATFHHVCRCSPVRSHMLSIVVPHKYVLAHVSFSEWYIILSTCEHTYSHSMAGQAGVVENAVLLGAPVSMRAERWRMATRSVAGRFINGFSRRDWVLSVVYRGSNGAAAPRRLRIVCAQCIPQADVMAMFTCSLHANRENDARVS
jgi:pimeloyl-ACP methyl ester carboxylesterase